MQTDVGVIVNADDYGYSDSVCQGILHLAAASRISATGVLSNCNNFEKYAALLKQHQSLDTGVHLTLTSGKPLSRPMIEVMAKNGTHLFKRNKYSAIADLLLRKIPINAVENEWNEQIDRCTSFGLLPCFLNSHEHLHMFPPLFELVKRLAKKHGIKHIRRTSAEWLPPISLSGLIRSAIICAVELTTSHKNTGGAPLMLGASVSGKLDESYLIRRLAALEPGKRYELMCHPGFSADNTIKDKNVIQFHDWETELNALERVFCPNRLRQLGVKMISYADLD